MTTHAPSTPNGDYREDTRTRWLTTFLVLPCIVAPIMTAVAALALGRDPFPWSTIGWVFLFACFAASTGGMAVLLTPRLANWFGVESLAERHDERGREIFSHAALVALGVAIAASMIAAMAGSMAGIIILTMTNAAFYTSMLVLSRKI